MKALLAIPATLLGLAAGTPAEEKKPARKPAQYNPKEIGVDKTKADARKKVKGEGPELDAAKNARKASKKAKAGK